MLDFLKLLLPLFLTPKNYYDVRQKLGAFVVYEVWFATYLLSDLRPVSEVLMWLQSAMLPSFLLANYNWLGHVNLSGLLIAVLVGVVFFVFHMHDRISDVLGLRARFDLRHIIQELAISVSTPLSASQTKSVKKKQDHIMRQVFYKYTSSKAERPLVDKHDIEQALESWSWFWVCLEGLLIWILCGAIALLYGGKEELRSFLILVAIYTVIMFLIWPFLKRRARVQVEAICSQIVERLFVLCDFVPKLYDPISRVIFPCTGQASCQWILLPRGRGRLKANSDPGP